MGIVQSPASRSRARTPIASRVATNVPDLALALAPVAEAAADDDPMTSYPFRIDPDKVREYPELKVKSRDFQLTTGAGRGGSD